MDGRARGTSRDGTGAGRPHRILVDVAVSDPLLGRHFRLRLLDEGRDLAVLERIGTDASAGR